MKRVRAIDVPKFRRPVKISRARLGESVYFNPGGFVYVKLLLIWLSCILLDLLIGFRVELLWPLWLMIRHLYDAFRVQNFVSSFHYSAFSVFFVCITATSDLICYLFIPVQILVFIASTYVWIQFVYQSTERCTTSSFLVWGLFVGFEYVVRCRFDQSTLYLTRGSWLTAGMFSSTGTDNIFVGNSQESLSRFEIYKPFAAHCLGYPIVTLGFRVKSYFSSWRLKRRKLEVTKQNEFYYRLLADAQPAPYDGRLISSSSKQLALENAEFEIDDENASENGTIITSQPTICSQINGTTNTNGIFTSTAPNNPSTFNRKSRNINPKSTTPALASSKSQQNGYFSTNGAICTKRNGSKRDDEIDSNDFPRSRRRSFSVVRSFFGMGHFVFRSIYEFFILPAWSLFSLQLGTLLKSPKSNISDDLISVSGDGSLLADEEESDREDLFGSIKNDISNTTKRRSKRTRGRTPAVAGEIFTSNAPSQQQIKPQATIAPSFAIKSEISMSNSFSSQLASTINSPPENEVDKNDLYVQNGRLKEKSKSQEKCKCSIKIDELENKLRAERSNSRQQVINMEREKEILEQALDNLRTDIRSNETTLRAELSLVQNQERSQRVEINQLRGKLNDSEQRIGQAARQLERLKKESAVQQTKRDSTRMKREDTRSGTPDQQQQQMSKELSDMRIRVQSLEVELKTKKDAYVKLEQRVKLAESSSVAAAKEMASGDNEIKAYQQKISELQQTNAHLEKTLMSENRLKVDLFRALRIASLKGQPQQTGVDEDCRLDNRCCYCNLDKQSNNGSLETPGLGLANFGSPILTDSNQLETLTSMTDRIRNGFESTLGSDFNSPPLPSSLIASLENGFGSGNSSPTDRISPNSSSPHSIVTNVESKSPTTIANELEQILQNNGQYSYFGDSYGSIATPSTNAQAKALAQQLKMSASPIGSNKPRMSSRCASPSAS